MYSKIRSHKPTLETYAEKLIGEGLITADDVAKLKADGKSHLEADFEAGQDYRPNKADWLDGAWKEFKPAELEGPRRGQTGVALDKLVDLGTRMTQVLANFNVHKPVKRAPDNRRSAIGLGEGINWATAEVLAFGTLVDDGH